jgi:hypothetical protein
LSEWKIDDTIEWATQHFCPSAYASVSAEVRATFLQGLLFFFSQVIFIFLDFFENNYVSIDLSSPGIFGMDCELGELLDWKQDKNKKKNSTIIG